MTFADTDLCLEYRDIELQITATCERPTTRSQVYQYEVEYNYESGVAEIRYDKRRGAENSTVTIDKISWNPSPSTAPSSSAADAASCKCNGLNGGDSYYGGGYGGGVGGGATDGGTGGGIAIASVDLDRDGPEPAGDRQVASHLIIG